VITLVWDECSRSTLPAASAAEVHSIPDMHAAASDEFGATYIDVRKCIARSIGRTVTFGEP
jgi:hypothetical protein